MKPITEQQIKRVEQDWLEIAGEPVSVEFIDGVFYGYCSELGTLRLEHKYNNRDKAESSYSSNLNTFYFRLETKL